MGLTAFHGFCMALADSVPGVSGGTIAFILGFYDRFLDALHQLFGTDTDARRAAVRYLLQLGLGWVVGMVASVAALAELFASQVYFMSSLFLGLTLASFPFVIRAERRVLHGQVRNCPFALFGLLLVLGLYGGKQPAVQARRFLHVPRLNAVMLFYERPYHRLKCAEKHAVYAVARGLGQPVMELVHLLLRVAVLLKCVNATLHLGIRAVVYILACKPCAFHLHQPAEVHHIRKYGMIQLYRIV